MPELILKLFDVGGRPLRTERLAADSADAAVALARARVRSSRFRRATVQIDGACFTICADAAQASRHRAEIDWPDPAYDGRERDGCP